MTSPDLGRDALAGLVTAMLDQPDVADLLAGLVVSAAGVLQAELVAVLASDRGLTHVLASTTHELERLDSLLGHAPGTTDRSNGGRPDAGDHHAVFDLVWCGQVFGALHVRGGRVLSADGQVVAQSFADVAALAVVAACPSENPDIGEQLEAVLLQRDVIEQAKGVLAHTLGIETHEAHDRLLQRSLASGQGVVAEARQVVRAVVLPTDG